MKHPDQYLNSILPNSNAAVQFQRTIRNNANDLREYLTDLYKWETGIEENKSQHKQKQSRPVNFPVRGAVDEPTQTDGSRSVADGSFASLPAVDKTLLRKNKVPLADYYKAWDKFDPSEQLEREEAQEAASKLAPNPYVTNSATSDHPFFADSGKGKSKNVGLVVQGGVHRRTKGEIEDLKNDGNEMFRQRDYLKAIDIYSQCLVRCSAQL